MITQTPTNPQTRKKNVWRPLPPPLEPGDRLTRAEFERRYEAMPEIKKAELIEGVVHMSSPVRLAVHGAQHAKMMIFLGNYYVATPNLFIGDNSSVRLDPDNEVQPDILLMLDEKYGGQASLSEDGYVTGAPELIVEIAASSVSYDLYDKFKVYRRNGVREYAVWQVYDGRLDWFVLEGEAYIPLPPDEAGIIRSRVFPGLWLAVEALLADEMKTVLTILQQGLRSQEYVEFVTRLA
ncbi:MAG: Uma2 family endonuclease [Chloroflexi bacterium]|nr:Uma2 family endonuclease [Chloroflexota bacterium]